MIQSLLKPEIKSRLENNKNDVFEFDEYMSEL